MFLKRGIFINWGNIPQLEFDFGPINLFSGGNGSGETTAADAIQSLMTAAHENLFTYNPGQDETTQRGRGGKQVRTLASYVLGCDDGSYARPWDTDGYVAGIFHPTHGEVGEAFSVVMCMRAHLDQAGNHKQARLDELKFIILPGVQLRLAHFIKDYSDGKHLVPITEIEKLLKKEFGEKYVEAYDKKGPYLRRLYGILRGKRDAVSDREAKHAARTFSNFMAYKPVKSITEFVAREVLEPRDLGDAIRSVSDLMKTIHGMESDAKSVLTSINVLSNALTQAESYSEAWKARAIMNYTESAREVYVNQKAYQAAKKQQARTREAISETENSIVIGDSRRKQVHAEIINLEAQRQGIHALKSKDEFERKIENCNQKLVAQAKPLLLQDQQFHCNTASTQDMVNAIRHISVATDIPEFDSHEYKEISKKVLSFQESATVDLQQLLGKDWIDIAPLEQMLDGKHAVEQIHNRWVSWLHDVEVDAHRRAGGLSIRDQLTRLVSKCENTIASLSKQISGKEKEIYRLESKRVDYPGYIEAAVNEIKQRCPAADPRVLCDYVDVLDQDWQMAIEGYIGGARFAIIVEPDYEADAIKIVRGMSGNKRRSARVIQGMKAQRDASRVQLPKQSIIEVMEFHHKTAEYYLTASYGNVLKVDTAEALTQTSRGLTSDGLASGNYSLWRCDVADAELVFGAAARERALRAKQEELAILLREVKEAQSRFEQLSTVLNAVNKMKSVHCVEVIRDMMEVHRELKQAENELANLELDDFHSLEEQLDALKQRYTDLEEEGKVDEQALGGLKEKLKQIDKSINKLSDNQEALGSVREVNEDIVNQIVTLDASFEKDEALTLADRDAEQAGDQITFNDNIRSVSARLEQVERELFGTVQEHNQLCHTHDTLLYEQGYTERHDIAFFKRILGLHYEIGLIHNRLKNNVLVEKHENLSRLKESFNTAFVTNLCHSIYQSINDGKRILDDLNKELEHHRFGADKERFYFSYDWVPEYRDYWRFFKELINLPTLGDGATLFDADLSKQSCKVRDQLLSMLLDKDEQQAMRELERISDYRHYRRYEIFKEPKGKAPIALSKYGTGSGGQLETPAYIIRSAAVTSAFRFNEGSNHLRMVLVDEAFSKMDETRSREVISYLTETLGLQLVFIMPTSKSGPFMDLISNQFVFSKCPTTVANGELQTRVLVDRKSCNEEKIKQLWANHRKTIRHQGMLDFMESLVEA